MDSVSRSTPSSPAEPSYEYRDALAMRMPKGRSSGINPGNRFESTRLHVLGEYLDELVINDQADPDAVSDEAAPQLKARVYHDRTRTILNPINSPDLGFGWTMNPYRGCEHGCIYCYARQDHEYLGMSSGLDFETKILAKVNAPELLRKELNKPSWQARTIMLAGDTDCYQPLEAKLKLTRQCLEVLAEARQPVSIVTKNRLVLRDLDLLREMAAHRCVSVAVSITSLDHKLSAKMEPRASSPNERLKTITALREAGVPAMVMTAPIIPGLNDKELPALLKAASEAGAMSAGWVILRLPHQVKAIFLDWLQREFPDRAKHVETLIRDTRGGELYNAEFGVRQKGTGEVAKQIGNMFDVFARKYGLKGKRNGMGLSSDSFVRPRLDKDQGTLF